MANNRYTERMREKERLQSQGREQRRAQRQEFENQRRQAFQQGVLERRARAEEFRGMAAGVPAGTGINTLANRQQYVVGGKLPEGMEAPARPSYVAAAARGQSLPEYEATQQAARQQRMAADLEREKIRAELAIQRIKSEAGGTSLPPGHSWIPHSPGAQPVTAPPAPFKVAPGETVYDPTGKKDPFTGPLGPMTVKPGEVVVDPVTGEKRYAAPDAPVTLRPGESLVRPGSKTPAYVAPPGLMEVSPGGTVFDPKTGESRFTAPGEGRVLRPGETFYPSDGDPVTAPSPPEGIDKARELFDAEEAEFIAAVNNDSSLSDLEKQQKIARRFRKFLNKHYKKD